MKVRGKVGAVAVELEVKLEPEEVAKLEELIASMTPDTQELLDGLLQGDDEEDGPLPKGFVESLKGP